MLLDFKTLSKVKKLCKNSCANYEDNNCILADSTCDYFTGYGRSTSCDYFEEAVLPNDKTLQEAYQEQHGISYTDNQIGKYHRTCKACDSKFKTDSKNKITCSDGCRNELRKQTKSKYNKGQSKH